MLRQVFRGARWLDRRLEEHLGRPYNAMLSLGLTLEMIHRVQHLPDTWKPGAHDPLGSGMALVMEAALLIHQLGELSERSDRRRERAAAARAKKAG